jgi:hypothetical protein
MVTPSKFVRGAHPTKNQWGITSPSKAKYQQRKLHQTPASEGLRITNMVTPPKLVRGAHPTKPMCHHLAVKGEIPTMKVITKRSQAKAYKKPKRDHHPNRCAERTLQNQCVITSPSRAKDQ